MLDSLDLHVITRGEVSTKTKEYAREKIARVSKLVRDPILFARVKLIAEGDPSPVRPVIAQATLDLNGVVVRAQTAAGELHEAIDLLEERLRAKLDHVTARRQTIRRRGPATREPHEWRHGDAPTRRTPFFDRPVEEREIVRHKSLALNSLSPAEAADEMDLLGYDFHLFVCDENSAPSLIARDENGEFSLATAGRPPSSEEWFSFDPAPVPTLLEQDAIDALNLSGRPHVFFLQKESGAAAVLYRRYDGHYGLITVGGDSRS